MSFELPELPWSKDALQPYISAETIDFHYGKHHRGYVTRLNTLTKDTPDAQKSLEELIKTANPGPIFNSAAQVIVFFALNIDIMQQVFFLCIPFFSLYFCDVYFL